MTSSPTDRELIRRGSAEAFGLLFDRHAPLLRRWIRAETRDGEVAADVVAETFAQAWEHRETIRLGADDSVWPWLFGIARNLVRQWRRRGVVDSRGRARIGMTMPKCEVEPYDETNAEGDAELLVSLSEALSHLTAAQRDAIQLRVVEELDYHEVARRLEISEGTARTQVHRALQALRGAITGGTS